jgi:flagellar secretion chaperone FliS
MTADHYNSYRASAVAQAEPVKLVEMMYEGAVRFTTRAIKAIAAANPEDAHNNILRAYAVVAELMATLDFEQGGEIAVRLEQCYDFILHLLKEADIRKEVSKLEQVLKLLEPMLETWREAFTSGGKPVLNGNGNGSGDGSQEGAPVNGKSQGRAPLDITG